MTQPPKISLSQFTSAVQSAVTGAIANHPKFSTMQAPPGITVSYLIRGIPVPDSLLTKVTLAETQAFADEVATAIGGAHPAAVAAARGVATGGAMVSAGRHVIIGVLPPPEAVTFEK